MIKIFEGTLIVVIYLYMYVSNENNQLLIFKTAVQQTNLGAQKKSFPWFLGVCVVVSIGCNRAIKKKISSDSCSV